MKKKTTKKQVKEVNVKGEVSAIGNANDVRSSMSSSKIPLLNNKLSPYDIFKRCIGRAKNLVSFKVNGMSKDKVCDAYRAAVVLSISALDAFLRTLVITNIIDLLADTNKPLNTKLQTYIKNLLNPDQLLEAARKSDLFEKVEKSIRDDFETKSFQGEWKINTFMELIGYPDIFEEISIQANKSKKRLKDDLGKYTSRRHIIAHSGDYDLNQLPHTEMKIDKAYAENCLEFVAMFTKNIHELTNPKK